jgi:hypothetical protein
VYRDVGSAHDEPGPAREAVNRFADHVEAGRYDAAYDVLCAATRDDFTLERFTQIASARPRLTGHRVTRADVVAVGGNGSGGVTADLTYADGGAQSHLFRCPRRRRLEGVRAALLTVTSPPRPPGCHCPCRCRCTRRSRAARC